MYKLTLSLVVLVFFATTGSAQAQKEPPCRIRFAVAEKTALDRPGVWPDDAIQWWAKDGKKKFKELCDSPLENADFVLSWERKSQFQEVCEPDFPEPTYPDYSRPDYWPPTYPDNPQPSYPDYSPPTYPDYSQPPYSPPTSSPPTYSPPGTLPPGAGIFCPDCYSQPAKGKTVVNMVATASAFLAVGGRDSEARGTSPTGINHFQPGRAVVYLNYAPANRTRLVSSSSSSECHEVWEERVSVNVYRAPLSADKLVSAKSIAKKEGRGGKPGKAAFQSAMKTLRKEAKKARTAKTQR